MTRPPPSTSRSGAVLLLIVGICAMLAVLAVTFLTRMRQDATMADDALRLAQNRLMLHAAISYLQESSRLGYAQLDGDGHCTNPREAWGWIDTRVLKPNTTVAMTDAERIGPNDVAGKHLWSPGTWPAPGTAMRAPMHRMVRPPFAVKPVLARNPIPDDPSKPSFGVPFFTNCDPIPSLPEGAVFDQAAPAPDASLTIDGTTRGTRAWWARGDRTPVAGSTDLAWFRCWREDGTASDRPSAAGPIGATFIVTVGSGGTQGFRDWQEVSELGAAQQFGGDQALFNELLATEARNWYRLEWSAAVGGGEDLATSPLAALGGMRPQTTWYEAMPLNPSRVKNGGEDAFAAPAMPRNYIGTIRYVQRLPGPPAERKW